MLRAKDTELQQQPARRQSQFTALSDGTDGTNLQTWSLQVSGGVAGDNEPTVSEIGGRDQQDGPIFL